MPERGGERSILLSLAFAFFALVGGGHALAEDPDAGPRGSLPREAIRRVIRANLEQVRACFERELAREATLEGRIVMSIVIGGDGSVVTAVAASSSMTPAGERAAAVGSCLETVVRTFRFPPTGGGSVLVHYPFIFDTTGGAPPPARGVP